MSLFKVFDVAGTGLNAETIRLNTVASNLANAQSESGDPTQVYRAREPVFQTILDRAGAPAIGAGGFLDTNANAAASAGAGVRVLGIVQSQAPVAMRYEPNSPLANKNGYVYASNVNPIEELANMISANRAFSTDVDAINTARDLLLKTIAMGH